ncbi:zinc finger C2HC domain-containing protein 1C-like [Diaphorina citri]|uniref:Zinc finger C2HC domain-containing protein 1C-like n=1 Tax=Diaphorina citri TaxID=121845 RepID=A0A3Q0J7D9_DIACI|nr:zinc finger C2HC domain-containing protein 1C-like [Diaphorina citri]
MSSYFLHRQLIVQSSRFSNQADPCFSSFSQKPAKSNWRKKHEEFIANIRAAKQAQDFIKNGGDVRDLPPPPPMDTSDLVPCPHCGRKFSESAAERHIPKCANMRHNKPAPGKAQKSTVRR